MNILRLSILIGLFAITGSFAPPANADCPHRGNFNHRHCDEPAGGNGDDTDPALYMADWGGEVEGTSFGPDGALHPSMTERRNWIAGNKKSIGLNIGGGTPSAARNVGRLTKLDFFIEFFGDDGSKCFSDDDISPLGGWLGQASIAKRSRGKAEFSFWFLGYTRNPPEMPVDSDRISYLLTLIGEPNIDPFGGDDWLPTTTTLVRANTWELSTQGIADDVSCSGSGIFIAGGVCADVTLIDNPIISLCNL